MRERRRCEGIIIDRPSHLPYWKRCTAFALVDLDYCTVCFQRRVQNDAARACLVPGWENIIKGDDGRRGRGKPRIALEEDDQRVADEMRKRAREGTLGTTEPVLLDKSRRPPATREPAALPPPAPELPDDIFVSARKALAAMTKI
jgi:hypothetical protein